MYLYHIGWRKDEVEQEYYVNKLIDKLIKSYIIDKELFVCRGGSWARIVGNDDDFLWFVDAVSVGYCHCHCHCYRWGVAIATATAIAGRIACSSEACRSRVRAYSTYVYK